MKALHRRFELPPPEERAADVEKLTAWRRSFIPANPQRLQK